MANRKACRQITTLAAVVTGLTLLVAAPAAGTSVPVANFSFELPAKADNSWSLPPTSWLGVGSAGNFNPTNSAYSGTTGDPGADSIPGTGLGHHVAFTKGGGQLSQQVGMLQANSLYTLTVAAGQRLDNPSVPPSFIELRATSAAGTVLASAAVTTTQDTFQDTVLVLNSTTFPGEIGNDLYIALRSSGTSIYQTNWDNVRLDSSNLAVPAAVIPEPFTMAGVALSIAGVGCYIRKRRTA